MRTLVIPPQQDMHTWLKYASLCRKSKKLVSVMYRFVAFTVTRSKKMVFMVFQMLSYKTLKMLLGVESLEEGKIPISYTYPQVTFAFCKHLWEAGQTNEAYM